MEFAKKYITLLIIQCVFIILFIIFLTAVRFFDNTNFEKLKDIYTQYSTYDVSTSLVYSGE